MRPRVVWAVVIVMIAAGSIASLLIFGPQRGEAKESDEPVDPRLVDADTAFGLKLFKELAKADKGKNIFISPASVSLALSMTYNGASANVKQAMAKTLELQGMSLDEVNKANAALLSNMKWPGPGVTLNIANSLWAREGVEFEPEFVRANRDYYDAEIAALDFSDPSAKDRINGWIEDKTEGRIKDVIREIGRNSILFLVNAIYFKGEWRDKFEKRHTRDGEFTLRDGSKKTVPMMNRRGEYRCLEAEGFRAIELPYGKRRLSMYVFLPDRDSSLTELYPRLTQEHWEQWMQRFREMEGEVSLPRFRVDYEKKLNDILIAMGMGSAFAPSSDGWRAMTATPGVFIDKVLHKTFVEVNEEGVEAAAATVDEMVAGGPMAMPVPFIVDRPFFFAIRDNNTGVVLFVGAVVDPTGF